MPRQPFSLLKGDAVENVDYRDNLPENMMPILHNILDTPGYYISFPGLTQVATGYGTDRGAVYNERLSTQFRVTGTDFVEVLSDGSVTKLGTIPGTNQVVMPYSFNTQCIIAEGNMYLYDRTNGFRQVTDPDLGSPYDATWIDGYYFLTDGEYIYHTDLTDESSIDPLKFATAEFMPDPSLAVVKTQDNKIVVFGRYSIEYFIDVAADNFAFQRVNSRGLKIGIISSLCKCEVHGHWYFIGSRKNETLGVHVLSAGQTQKISTREIDKLLAQYSDADFKNVRMETWEFENSSLVIIHLPNEVLCFRPDIAVKYSPEVAWFKLKSDIQGNTPYRAINGVYDPRFSAFIVGDKQNTNIGKLDLSKATQYGNKVEWILYSPFLALETASINELELETISGDYTSDGEVTVAFSMTKDGRTYSKEFWASYGAPNEYNKRFILRRLGYVNNWVGFKFRGISDARVAFARGFITYD